jgi:DNA-binding HxlR family transcriptional regulator
VEDGTHKSVASLCDTDSAKDFRRILDIVGDKWSLLVIFVLQDGTRRFSELQREIGSITQRMLTRTLRQLERSGLVERTVYATVPPRVDYQLTPLGETLLESIHPLMLWASANQHHVAHATQSFDAVVTREREVRDVWGKPRITEH